MKVQSVHMKVTYVVEYARRIIYWGMIKSGCVHGYTRVYLPPMTLYGVNLTDYKRTT